MASEAVGTTTSVLSPRFSEANKVDQQRSAEAVQKTQTVEAVNKTDAADKEVAKASEAERVQKLDTAVEQINTAMKEGQRSLSFAVDHDAGQVVVKVTNTQTDELVRQIPNEEALKLAEQLESMMGLIFDDKA